MKFTIETIKAGEDLLKCLRAILGTCGFDELSFSPERWTRLADVGAKAGLSPLLFRGLPVADASLGIPQDVISRWLHDYLASKAWNDRLYQCLAQVLAVFNREGISAIVLKGVYLMDTLYPERAMRTVGDIDILLHPEDKARSMRIMEELGYVCFTSPFLKDPSQYGYSQPNSNVVVELHFQIDTDTQQEPDILGFWERSQTIEINGQKARALTPEDLLVHLCLHLTHHPACCPPEYSHRLCALWWISPS